MSLTASQELRNIAARASDLTIPPTTPTKVECNGRTWAEITRIAAIALAAIAAIAAVALVVFSAGLVAVPALAVTATLITAAGASVLALAALVVNQVLLGKKANKKDENESKELEKAREAVKEVADEKKKVQEELNIQALALTEKANKLDETEKALNAEKARAGELQAQLEAAKDPNGDAAKKMNDELVASRNKVKELDAKVKEEAAAIEKLKDEHAKDLASKEQEKINALEEANKKVAAADKKAKEFDDARANAEAGRVALNNELNQKRDEIGELNKKASARVDEANKQIAKLQDEIKAHQEVNEKLKKQIEEGVPVVNEADAGEDQK